MRRVVPLFGALLGLSGCVSGPCDPNTNRSLFTAAGCMSNGGFQQRVDQRRAVLDASERNRGAVEQQRAAAGSRLAALSDQEQQLRAQLRDEQGRAVDLSRRVADARARGQGDQARLARLGDDIVRLRQEQDRLAQQPPGDSMRERMAQVLRRREELSAQYNATLRGASDN